MTAAVKTPTSVQKTYIHATGTYGTPVRIVRYFVVITGTANSDWFVGATYTPGTYLGSKGYCIDSSGDGTVETLTYVAAGTKVTMAGGVAGTKYIEVLVQEA